MLKLIWGFMLIGGIVLLLISVIITLLYWNIIDIIKEYKSIGDKEVQDTKLSESDLKLSTEELNYISNYVKEEKEGRREVNERVIRFSEEEFSTGDLSVDESEIETGFLRDGETGFLNIHAIKIIEEYMSTDVQKEVEKGGDLK